MTLLKVDVRGDIEAKSVTQLGYFLKLMGCRWGKAVKTDVRGKRVLYYQVDPQSLELACKYARKRVHTPDETENASADEYLKKLYSF